MRIDDRLIHGQIVTAWITYSAAKAVVVADDAAAEDDVQKALLQMAAPAGVTLHILRLAEAAAHLRDDTADTPVFVIVRGPRQANALLEQGVSADAINVGNVGMKKGKKQLLPYLWLDEAEAGAFRELDKKNARLDVRAVPTDRPQNAMDLIHKHF
jgi:mannose/fructose/N-acetylgalactosamine-specific phosphotransferase system component IIB